MNLVCKKNPVHRRKIIFTDANLIKQQKEQYTSLPMWLRMYKILHQGNGVFYSSVKGNAVTSGQEVDNNWA